MRINTKTTVNEAFIAKIIEKNLWGYIPINKEWTILNRRLQRINHVDTAYPFAYVAFLTVYIILIQR